ncbi:LysR family transcriptional regulator [Paraburkholderia agricolaris]|jgi:DNA-binding transcriptional LysR family regulator|uniref:LysR family transcriptional regulator n=1 Tax=Paraburkholderia agricolaris TaxID=2152888 RepID=A0ABW8ZJ53_9BURK
MELRRLEIRHLRYFLILSEELHFQRAASRLHIEQSPLSRSIKELESELGVRLFERNRHGTRLTWAGVMFRDGVHRVMKALEQAQASAHLAASGYRGTLRIAVSEGVAVKHLSDLLTLSRRDEPRTHIQLSEVTFRHQVKGLQQDLYDATFAHAPSDDKDIVSIPIWDSPLVLVLPDRHPLLNLSPVPLAEALRYPLLLPSRRTRPGTFQQITEPLPHPLPPFVEAASARLMFVQVSAGHGIGIASEHEIEAYKTLDLVSRPLAELVRPLVTYVLRRADASSPELERFIDRAQQLVDTGQRLERSASA